MIDKGFLAIDNGLKAVKQILVTSLTEFVISNGDDFKESNDCYRNVFGINEDKYEDDTKILKVIDITNNGGCYFPWSNSYKMNNIDNQVYEWRYSMFYALYLVEEYGIERLKCCVLEDVGVECDSNKCELKHCYVELLSLQELEKLCEFCMGYISNKIR